MGKENKQTSLLRGSAWNGVAAPLVRFIGSGQQSGSETIDLETLQQRRGHDLPALIYIEEVGTYAFGSTPDQLERNVNGAGEKVKLRSRRGRADTVRGKVCAVTGGAQGFGKEIVLRFVEDGAFVFIADMNFEGARDLANELNQKSGSTTAFPVEVNVTDESSVEKMVDQIVKTTGGIDVFVNNAGVLKAGSVKEFAFKDFSFVTNVNYYGYFLCAKHVSQVMALQYEGDTTNTYFTDIIQINSKSGLVGSNKNSAYAGGKFGGIGLTQSFALELVEDRIKVNSICPGNFFDGPLWSDPQKGLFVQYLNTGKVPGAKSIEDVKRFYEAKVPMGRGCMGTDVYKAILYCVEQQYETGQAVPVTGGQVMLS